MQNRKPIGTPVRFLGPNHRLVRGTVTGYEKGLLIIEVHLEERKRKHEPVKPYIAKRSPDKVVTLSSENE